MGQVAWLREPTKDVTCGGLLSSEVEQEGGLEKCLPSNEHPQNGSLVYDPPLVDRPKVLALRINSMGRGNQGLRLRYRRLILCQRLRDGGKGRGATHRFFSRLRMNCVR